MATNQSEICDNCGLKNPSVLLEVIKGRGGDIQKETDIQLWCLECIRGTRQGA
jgi:hypothetical protein